MSTVVWIISADAAYVDDGIRVVAVTLKDLASCQPHVLEDTAASIWRALGVGQESAIIRAVAGVYGEDDKDVAEDVRWFLRQLKAKGLVEEVA